MKSFLKLLSYLLLVAILISVLLISLAAYLYYHPEQTKRILLKTLTKNLNRRIEAEKFYFKLQPLVLEAERVKIYRKDQSQKPELVLKKFSIAAKPSRKNLWDIWRYKHIRIEGLTAHLTEKFLEEIFKPSTTPQNFITRSILRWFLENLKKKFEVEEVSFSDCSASWQSRDLSIELDGINLNIGRSEISKIGPLDIKVDSFNLVSRSLKNLECTISGVEGSGKVSFENGIINLESTLHVEKLQSSTEDFGLEKASLDARILYSPPFINIEAITLTIPEETPVVLKIIKSEKLWGKLTGSLIFDLRKKLLKHSTMKISVLNIFEIASSAASSTENPDIINLRISSSPVPVEKLYSIYKSKLPAGLQKLRFLAPWHPKVTADINATLTDSLPIIRSSVRIGTERLRVGSGQTEIQCSPRLSLDLLYKNKHLEANGSLELGDGFLQISNNKSVNWDAKVLVNLKDSLLAIDKVTIHARSGKIPILPKITLEGKSFLDMASSQIKECKAILKGPEIGTLNITIEGGWNEKDKITCIIDWGKHNLGKILDFYDITRTPWEIIASNKIKLMISRLTDTRSKIHVVLKAIVDSLSDRDYQYGGEKISINGDLVLDVASGGISFKGKVLAPKGELLAKLYYVNFTKNAFSWNFSGKYNEKNSVLIFDRSRLDLRKIVTLFVPGSFRFKNETLNSFAFRVKIPDTPVTQLFDFFVKEPYKDEIPNLNTLTTRGEMGISLMARGTPSRPTIKGEIFLDQLFLKLKNKKTGEYTITGKIPVWLEPLAKKNAWKQKEKPLETKIKISIGSLPLLGNFAFTQNVYALPNLIRFNDHIIVKNDTFDLNIKPIEILFQPPKRMELETGLQVNKVNLGKIISTFVSLNKPLEGYLTGNLPLIKIENGNLRSRGSLTAKIFHGTVKITHLTVENVFSANRIFGAEIDFSDLNLEELTTITNFGKITGVLEGYIHNLKIAYGQPVSFDALFQTVKKKGISQKINVKAVDNIAQLGGSGSSFQGLGKLVTVFFKEFPYEQIGIRCKLNNDVFTIRGTVISDHTEYLVKRSGFTGINVINRNPNNNISFKDMIKRLKRITKTSKPVVNP